MSSGTKSGWIRAQTQTLSTAISKTTVLSS